MINPKSINMSLKLEKTIKRYSISFRQMVVREIEEGKGYEHVRKKYDIGGMSTINNWVKLFGKDHLLNKIVKIETMDEQNRFKQLEQENRKLKEKLADIYMIKDCLEEVIKLANEEYRTDLKKNFGTRLPNNSEANTQ